MNNKLFHKSQQSECEKKKVVESVPIFLRKMTFNDPQGSSGLVIYLHLLLLWIINPIFNWSLHRRPSQIQNLVNHYEYNILEYLYHSFPKAFSITTKAVENQ